MPSNIDLDIQIGKTIKYANKQSLEFSIELMNITSLFRKNVAGIKYNDAYKEDGKYYQMGFLPTFHVNYRFEGSCVNKLGFIGVFVLVAVAHFVALQSFVPTTHAISKPKAKVHRITLSSVVVKKPKPKVAPIILPPDPKPIVEVKPIIEKPKPKPKPKKKKRVKRKKVYKPKPKPKPIVEKIVEEVIKPVVEQIAPIQQVDTSSIKDQYTSQIRRQIQRHLYYPKMAKRMRMQGVVRVAFRVLKDGSVRDIRVLGSSKKLLAKGAVKTLKALSLPAIPTALHEEFLDINIPIEFKLVKG